MLGVEAFSATVPPTPATHTTAPVPAPVRVVEQAEASPQARAESDLLKGPGPQSLSRLADAARRFAEVLSWSGSPEVAAFVSGFRYGHVDTYA